MDKNTNSTKNGRNLELSILTLFKNSVDFLAALPR